MKKRFSWFCVVLVLCLLWQVPQKAQAKQNIPIY